MWFTKSRRAQNDQDYETWIVGGVSPTLNAFDNAHETRATVVIVFAPGPMVRLGGNIWDNGVVPTLRAEAKRGDAEPHVLIIDGRRTGDVRVTTEPVYTLEARMGTGGNNVPVIATDVEGNEVAATLRGFGHGWQGQHNSTHAVAIPIQDGRDMEKKQNGLGIGEEGDPMYTLDQTGAQAVEHMMQVRRLTPTECERLMGWPDDHTATGTAGPVSDTNRYKMCGNGVASPVAEWIGQHLMAIPMLNKARPDAE